MVPKPILEGTGKARRSASSLRHQPLGHGGEPRSACDRESEIATDYLRVRAYPVHPGEYARLCRPHDRVYVVEQNRDAQMLNLLKIDLDPAEVVKLRSVLHFNGLPIDARTITSAIAAQEGASK
jgi:2-oxoglutarate ferredoxin oxidoreductase subunit alpha